MGAAPVTVCAHSGSAQRISRPTRRSYPTAASAAYSAVMKPPRSPLPARAACRKAAELTAGAGWKRAQEPQACCRRRSRLGCAVLRDRSGSTLS